MSEARGGAENGPAWALPPAWARTRPLLPPTPTPLSAPSASDSPAAASSRKPALPSPASALHQPLSGLHAQLCGSPMQHHAQGILSPSGPLQLGLHPDSLPARCGPVTIPRASDSSPGQ